MSTDEFERRFDAGEDITDMLDLASAERVYSKIQRVNVDFPRWMVDALDKEANRLGVTRQSLIKMWLAARLARVAS